MIKTGVINLTETKEVKGKSVKCPRCDYKWDYTGKSNRLCCPKCGRWFQRKYSKKLDKKQIKKIKNDDPKGELVECPKCGYKWDYTDKSNKIKCGKCGKQFQLKYSKGTHTTKIRNKGLSEKTLAFLGNDLNPVADRKFLMDNIAIVLGYDLTILVKNASKTKKMTEINLIRDAVKKYLEGGE